MEEKGTRQDNLDEGQEAVGRFREEPGAAPGGSSGTVHRNTPPLLRVEGRLCSKPITRQAVPRATLELCSPPVQRNYN